jgi:tetratricopeptide (TPR) repeat protein
MKLTKILRDLVILALAGVGLWAIYEIISMFGTSSTQANADSVSKVRADSDDFFESGEWVKAASNYRQLVEADPYNGDAWFRLGICHLKEVARLRSSESNDRAEPAAENTPNENESNASYTEDMEQAVNAFTQALDFPFFRNESRRNLAILKTYAGEYEEAVKWLQEAVDDGMLTRSGVLSVPEFEPLNTIEGFQAIVLKERENARNAPINRRNLPAVRSR